MKLLHTIDMRLKEMTPYQAKYILEEVRSGKTVPKEFLQRLDLDDEARNPIKRRYIEQQSYKIAQEKVGLVF